MSMIDSALKAAAQKFQAVTGRQLEYHRISDGSIRNIIATRSPGNKVGREKIKGGSLSCRRRDYIVPSEFLTFVPERNDKIVDTDGTFELYAPDDQDCFRTMGHGELTRLYTQEK